MAFERVPIRLCECLKQREIDVSNFLEARSLLLGCNCFKWVKWQNGCTPPSPSSSWHLSTPPLSSLAEEQWMHFNPSWSSLLNFLQTKWAFTLDLRAPCKEQIEQAILSEWLVRHFLQLNSFMSTGWAHFLWQAILHDRQIWTYFSMLAELLLILIIKQHTSQTILLSLYRICHKIALNFSSLSPNSMRDHSISIALPPEVSLFSVKLCDRLSVLFSS